MIHLPTGIVDFVGRQTEPVSAFLILGRFVFSHADLIAEALKLGPPIIQVPRVVTIRASRPNSLASATDAAFLAKRPTSKQTIVLGNIQSAVGKTLLLLVPRSKPGRRWRTWQRPRYESSTAFPSLPISPDAQGGLARRTGPTKAASATNSPSR